MTRKDYQALADSVLNALRFGSVTLDEQQRAEQALSMAMTGFMEHMQADNPRFDGDKFLKACGLQS